MAARGAVDGGTRRRSTGVRLRDDGGPRHPPDDAPESVTPQEKPQEEKAAPGVVEQITGNPAVRSFFRSAASAAGREITRGLFGTRRRR